MPETQRTLYSGAYRATLNDPDDVNSEPTDQDADAGNTSRNTEAVTPEESSWRKRYGDLRTHSLSLTERVKSLESQLQAAQKKEIKIPSSQEELQHFARQYPDVFRHIRSIAMAELLQERENIATETDAVRANLQKVTRELGLKKILGAHSDFQELNMSEAFHEWAQLQPPQIQGWLFEDDNPDLCIKAIDLYKAETGFNISKGGNKNSSSKRPTSGADHQVNTRGNSNIPDEHGNKRVWKQSEIGKLTPRQYEKVEDEIDAANREGRIDFDA